MQSPVSRVVYTIDGDDIIRDISGDWNRCAHDGGAPHLVTETIGRPLWSFIADVSTQLLYQELVAQVRAGRVATFPYRCDEAAVRRQMSMVMRPMANAHVQFESTTVAVHRLQPTSRPATHDARPPLTRMCSWCKRVLVARDWIDLESGIERLDLFGPPETAQVTHTICPTCNTEMHGYLASAADRRSV